MNIIIKAQLLNKKGTGSAILISALASAAILGMIVVSQQSISNFINQKSISAEQWQLDLIARHALTLGGYLISHNLVLCKEGGWTNEPNQINCTWNDRAETPSEEFQLTRTNDEDSIRKGSKQLTFLGTIAIKDSLTAPTEEHNRDPNEPGIYKYQISFDLQKWKNTDLESLVGKIPGSVCRHEDTLEIIQDGICENIDINRDGTPDEHPKIAQELIEGRENNNGQTPNIRCRDQNNNIIDHSSCEFISMVDQDHYIVVMTVKAPFDESFTTNPNAQILRSGVRRPLGEVEIKVTQPPSCPLNCASPLTANFFSGCRGDSIPTGNSQTSTEITDAKLEMEITNKGPGAIYALSLFKTYTKIDGHTNEDSQQAINDSVKVTEEILKLNGKEVLLPNDKPLKFTDQVPCLTESSVVIQSVLAGRQPQWRTGNPPPPPPPPTVTPSTDIHAQEFMNVEYSLGYLQSAENFSVCVNNNSELIDEANHPCPEIIPDSTQQQSTITSFANNRPCGKDQTGICRYPHIEPRRLFHPTPSEAAPGGVKQKVSILVKYVVPH